MSPEAYFMASLYGWVSSQHTHTHVRLLLQRVHTMCMGKELRRRRDGDRITPCPKRGKKK